MSDDLEGFVLSDRRITNEDVDEDEDGPELHDVERWYMVVALDWVAEQLSLDLEAPTGMERPGIEAFPLIARQQTPEFWTRVRDTLLDFEGRLAANGFCRALNAAQEVGLAVGLREMDLAEVLMLYPEALEVLDPDDSFAAEEHRMSELFGRVCGDTDVLSLFSTVADDHLGEIPTIWSEAHVFTGFVPDGWFEPFWG